MTPQTATASPPRKGGNGTTVKTGYGDNPSNGWDGPTYPKPKIKQTDKRQQTLWSSGNW